MLNLRGNRKLVINSLLAILAFIAAMTSHFSTELAGLYGVISGGFNWANSRDPRTPPPSE